MTEYKVLIRNADQHGWSEVGGTIEASSQRDAKRQALDDVDTSQPMEIVALPLRSWQPEHVEQELQTKLKWTAG